jgi:hypothetical protein
MMSLTKILDIESYSLTDKYELEDPKVHLLWLKKKIGRVNQSDDKELEEFKNNQQFTKLSA